MKNLFTYPGEEIFFVPSLNYVSLSHSCAEHWRQGGKEKGVYKVIVASTIVCNALAICTLYKMNKY